MGTHANAAKGTGSAATDGQAAGKASCCTTQPACGCGTGSASSAKMPVAATNAAHSASEVTPAGNGNGVERRGSESDRRKSAVDRRAGLDRRQVTREESGYTGPERRAGVDRRDPTGLERRRGAGVRRSDERRVAEEGEMNAHQFEFVMAVEAYKKVNKRLYPTWTEILEVLYQLGYRKVQQREVKLESVPEPELWHGDAEAEAEAEATDPQPITPEPPTECAA
jgi:hypothetical protein